MNLLRKTLLAMAFASCAVVAQAQTFKSSYFMETNNFRHQLNPALLDTTYFSIPVVGNTSMAATGNLSYSLFVFDYVSQGRKTPTLFMNPKADTHNFLSKLEDSNSADISIKMDLFTFAFPAFRGLNVVGASFKSNNSIRIPKSLFEFMENQKDIKNLKIKKHYSIRDLAFKSNNYLELSFGHSHRIGDRVRVGVKPKLLVGLALVDLHIKNIEVNQTITNLRTLTDLKFQLQGYGRINLGGLASQFTYDVDRKKDSKGRRRVDGFKFETLKLKNYGLAVDFGAEVKVIDGLKLSFSVTDLGFMSYNGVQHASTQADYIFDGFKEYNKLMESGSLDDRDELEEQFDALVDDVGVMFSLYDDGETDETQALTAQLNLGAEYAMPFYDKLRFTVLHSRNLSKLFSYNQTMMSFVVRPVSFVEVGFNTTFSSTGASAGLALGLNAGSVCFHFGSDRLMLKYAEDGLPYKSLNTDATLGISVRL